MLTDSLLLRGFLQPGHLKVGPAVINSITRVDALLDSADPLANQSCALPVIHSHLIVNLVGTKPSLSARRITDEQVSLCCLTDVQISSIKRLVVR
eukprot:SAG25_NODE_6624_length_544_cov_0.923596_1_plen_95_part_00